MNLYDNTPVTYIDGPKENLLTYLLAKVMVQHESLAGNMLVNLLFSSIQWEKFGE